MQVVDGTKSADAFISILKAIHLCQSFLKDKNSNDKIDKDKRKLQQCVANALWFWGSQTEYAIDKDGATRLSGLIKNIVTASLVDTFILKTSLEFNTANEAGLFPPKLDEKEFQKKLIKMNTALVYRQQKYNLLREETEGYAKLVVILSRLPISASIKYDNDNEISEYIIQVNSLIG